MRGSLRSSQRLLRLRSLEGTRRIGSWFDDEQGDEVAGNCGATVVAFISSSLL